MPILPEFVELSEVQRILHDFNCSLIDFLTDCGEHDSYSSHVITDWLFG